MKKNNVKDETKKNSIMDNITVKEITKKGLSLALAVVLGLSALSMKTNAASAETYTYGNATLVQQEVVAQPMTIEEFAHESTVDSDAVRPQLSYNHLDANTQCLEYLINIIYIPKETRQELIDKGIVYNVNFETYEGMELFADAYNLINLILTTNQKLIRKKECKTPDDIIDGSIYCYDEHDATVLRSIHENYFNAYKTMMKMPGDLIDNEYFNRLWEQLMTLSVDPELSNIHEASVGARWFGYNIYGVATVQLIQDYLSARYSSQELDRIFDRERRNAGQWVLRSDVSLDQNCLKNEIEVLAFYLGQAHVVFGEKVNNDIFRVLENFGVECVK